MWCVHGLGAISPMDPGPRALDRETKNVLVRVKCSLFPSGNYRLHERRRRQRASGFPNHLSYVRTLVGLVVHRACLSVHNAAIQKRGRRLFVKISTPREIGVGRLLCGRLIQTPNITYMHLSREKLSRRNVVCLGHGSAPRVGRRVVFFKCHFRALATGRAGTPLVWDVVKKRVLRQMDTVAHFLSFFFLHPFYYLRRFFLPPSH